MGWLNLGLLISCKVSFYRAVFQKGFNELKDLSIQFASMADNQYLIGINIWVDCHNCGYHKCSCFAATIAWLKYEISFFFLIHDGWNGFRLNNWRFLEHDRGIDKLFDEPFGHLQIFPGFCLWLKITDDIYSFNSHSSLKFYFDFFLLSGFLRFWCNWWNLLRLVLLLRQNIWLSWHLILG